MSKSLKIAVGSVAVVVGLFVGVSFYVSTQINPELIRAEAVKVLEKTFPNANVKLEKLDYSLGTNISFNIDNFSIIGKKDNQNLINVSQIQVKIPLISILTSGGNIDVLVNAPKIGFQKFQEDTNWDRAMGGKKVVPVAQTPAPEQKTEKESDSKDGNATKNMPAFIKNSKINFRVIDASVDYVLDANTKGNIVVSKVVVKNINIESSAAFEIASEFKMNMGVNQVSSNILIVGDFDIKKFLDTKEVSSNVVVKLIKNNFANMSLPSVQTKIKADINKKGEIDADLNITVENMITIKALANLKGDIAKLNKLDFGINFENSLKYLKEEMSITIKEIDSNNSELHLLGDLVVDLKTMKLNPNFNISTTKPLKLLVSGLEIASSFGGTIKGQDVNLSVKNELFKGVMIASVKTKVDAMNLPADLSKYNPAYVDVKATGFQIERADMQKLLYSGKVDKLSAEGQEIAAEAAANPPVIVEVPMAKLPPVFTNINFDQCFIGKDELKISGSIPFENNKASTKGIKINLGKGNGNVTFSANLKSNVRTDAKFDFSMKNLNFSTFTVFLPPTMERVEGYFTGKSNGVINVKPEGLAYNINADVEAGDGKIAGLQLGKIAGELLGGMKDKLEGKVEIPESQDIPDGFKKLSFKGQLTEKLINIKSFLFYGAGDKIYLASKGKKNVVSMVGKDSHVEADFKYTHGKTMSELKAKTGLSALPLKLEGKGFSLMPNIGYTTSALVSGATKAVVNKASNKAKDEAKKKAKKAAEKLKKDLLKKFKF